MYKYAIEGITVATIFDSRVQNSAENYPVKVRVTYKRDRIYFPTGKKMTSEDWEKLPETKSRTLISVRNDVQAIFDQVKEYVKALVTEGNFSFDALSRRVGSATGDTLNGAFKDKIKELDTKGREGSRLYYENVLNGIERYKGETIKFSTISKAWVEGYEKFLLDEKKTFTTVGMHMRAVRHILNQAQSSGLLKSSAYPFGAGKDKYQIPTGKGRKLALTLNQISQIVIFTDGNPKTEYYRDLWFFSYLCNGINFADMLKLKYSDIRNGEVAWYRQKTINTEKEKAKIIAELTPEMKAIIDRWGNEPRPDNFVFPALTGKETPKELKSIIRNIITHTNHRLERIGKALNIGKVTTYTSRHSFATVLKRSGANIAYISESLGHSDLKTTENYLASFERDERVKNSKLLTNFENNGKSE